MQPVVTAGATRARSWRLQQDSRAHTSVNGVRAATKPAADSQRQASMDYSDGRRLGRALGRPNAVLLRR